jgi:hypothetical protein
VQEAIDTYKKKGLVMDKLCQAFGCKVQHIAGTSAGDQAFPHKVISRGHCGIPCRAVLGDIHVDFHNKLLQAFTALTTAHGKAANVLSEDILVVFSIYWEGSLTPECFVFAVLTGFSAASGYHSAKHTFTLLRCDGNPCGGLAGLHLAVMYNGFTLGVLEMPVLPKYMRSFMEATRVGSARHFTEKEMAEHLLSLTGFGRDVHQIRMEKLKYQDTAFDTMVITGVCCETFAPMVIRSGLMRQEASSLTDK